MALLQPVLLGNHPGKHVVAGTSALARLLQNAMHLGKAYAAAAQMSVCARTRTGGAASHPPRHRHPMLVRAAPTLLLPILCAISLVVQLRDTCGQSYL
jgi:hypothetical protein